MSACAECIRLLEAFLARADALKIANPETRDTRAHLAEHRAEPEWEYGPLGHVRPKPKAERCPECGDSGYAMVVQSRSSERAILGYRNYKPCPLGCVPEGE